MSGIVVTILNPAPVTPPTVVRIELPVEDAQLLRAVMALDLSVPKLFQGAGRDGDSVKRFMNRLHAQLRNVL